ncbi:MAG: DUF1232 domain-containing protein [Planctomycetota bacterium]
MKPTAPTWFGRLKRRTAGLKRETLAMGLAMRHPATPWYAKLAAALVVAYALSPIDLIPDFIPVLGLLDDLLLVPLGVLAVRWLIPPAVLDDCRRQAAEGVRIGRLWLWAGATVVGSLWLACLAGLMAWSWRRWGR